MKYLIMLILLGPNMAYAAKKVYKAKAAPVNYKALVTPNPAMPYQVTNMQDYLIQKRLKQQPNADGTPRWITDPNL